jgi:autotransporter-associated beta strand protein
MKLRISNPFRSVATVITATLALGCFAASSTQAASIYWDGTSTSWNLDTNWSTNPGATTPDPSAVPGAADDAVFNISTVNDPATITLDANQAVNSMTFNNTGTTTLTGGGTARTLSLGTGGITVASGAGAVTLGSGAAGDNVLLNLSGAQTWVNNSANAFTINNDAATFTRATGATLLLNKASTGDFAISETVAPLVNTIIGPWAFFGTGADQKYAVSGATVTGKTGTSTGSMSHIGATTNYELSGSALTLGGGDYASNTIRYAGTGASYNFYNGTSGASTYTTNGILAVGESGTLTLRRSSSTGNATLIVGSAGELVIAGQQAVTISVPISESAVIGSRLTYSGSNTLTLSGVNSYNGATTVSSGILSLGASQALQNSPLNTTGSIAGDASNGLKTTLTALTLGGLTGNKDLASLFTTTDGGYSGVTDLTLKPVTGASHSYSGVIANGAANMNLIKSGAGTQILSGVNTYTGTTTLSGGTLILNNANALGTTPGVNGTSSISMAAGTSLRSNYIIADAGNVDSFVYAPITISGAGSVNFLAGAGSATAPAEAVTFNLNGAIGGTDGTNVVFSTAGSLNNPDSIIVLGAAATYDGNTTITVGSGTERVNVKAGVGVTNALPSTTVLTFGNTVGSGTGRLTQYDLNGNDQTLAGLDNGGVVPNLRNYRVTNSGALATLTINNSADFTFGGATLSGSSTTRAQITGNLALVKSGAGTFTLDGTLTGVSNNANTYTGNTTVNAGILRIGGINLNNESSTVTIAASGATLDLTYSGTDTVDKLFIGETQMAAGVYGPTATSIPQITNSAGTGTLTVTSGPAGGGFAAWQSANSTAGGLDEDHDGDGVSNGIEFFIYGPVANTGFTALPPIDNNAGTLSVTFTKAAGYNGTYGTHYVVETSATLADPWVPQVADPDPGFTVTFPSATEVKYTFPAGTKNFARLKVTGP